MPYGHGGQSRKRRRSQGVGHIWEIFKATRKIQEANVTIWRYIKFRDKYDKPPKSKTRIYTSNKRSRYCLMYHTGQNKGQETFIWRKINKIGINIIYSNLASSDEEEESTGDIPRKFKVD